MPLLEMRNVTKRFPGTLALSQVELSVERGEIHALMGENGAGKSTLMKVLSGVYQADDGAMVLDGAAIAPANPLDALRLGIAIVHQELSLVPSLTVGENIFPGRAPTNRFGFVRYDALHRNAAAVLARLEVQIDPRTPLGDLSIANQQLVEIAKALSVECKLLILDEPTSALTDHEAQVLMALLRRLAAAGVSILMISHKINEVFAVADRISVLRDGRYVGTVETGKTTQADVVRMMVGRELGDFYPPRSSGRGKSILEVRGLQLVPGGPASDFTLYEGEVLGVAGLIGSGRSELMRGLFGADTRCGGVVTLSGRALSIRSPHDAIRQGIGFVPEDRKAAGLFLDMAIKLNIQASSLSKVSARGFVSPARERTLAETYVTRLSVSAPGIDQEVRRLSGGNQQKVLLAKWLAIQPRVLIVDEPTRGIDVGAKRDIHFLLRSLADAGVGVLMISSELPEVLGMSDRILVMREGAIAGELAVVEASEEKIMHIASLGAAAPEAMAL